MTQKPYLLILVLILLAANSSKAQTISFVRTELDMGTFEVGDTIRATFKYKNTGRKDLKIYSVETKKPLEVISYNQDITKRGKEDFIRVAMPTSIQGKNLVGNILKLITVNSNDPDHPEVKLQLIAVVQKKD